MANAGALKERFESVLDEAPGAARDRHAAARWGWRCPAERSARTSPT